jgi:hypothetical protein
MTQWKSDLKGNFGGLSPSATPLERESFVKGVGLMIQKLNVLSIQKVKL